MAAFNPAPTAAQVQDRFNDVRNAGKGFIPPSAKFVLSHGRQAGGDAGKKCLDAGGKFPAY